VSSLLETLSRS